MTQMNHNQGRNKLESFSGFSSNLWKIILARVEKKAFIIVIIKPITATAMETNENNSKENKSRNNKKNYFHPGWTPA